MIPVTERTLIAVYDCLREFPPFKRLPPSDQINFQVGTSKTTMGEYTKNKYRPEHFIRISSERVGFFDTLCKVMAHEMLHLLQELQGTTTPGTEHNADFRKRGALIANRFGWDGKEF